MFTGLSTSDQLFCFCEKCCEAHNEPGLTIENAHLHNEYISTRTQVDLCRRPEGKSSERSRTLLDGCDEDGAEDFCSFEKDDDHERHCEGHIRHHTRKSVQIVQTLPSRGNFDC